MTAHKEKKNFLTVNGSLNTEQLTVSVVCSTKLAKTHYQVCDADGDVYNLFELFMMLEKEVNFFFLNARYVLVTGCDSGFGNLVTRQLDDLGVHVFAACFTKEGQDDLDSQTSDRVVAFHLDVTDHGSVEEALEFVKSRLPKGQGEPQYVRDSLMFLKRLSILVFFLYLKLSKIWAREERKVPDSSSSSGGGGGVGGYFHMHAYWECAARETPHFQP